MRSLLTRILGLLVLTFVLGSVETRAQFVHDTGPLQLEVFDNGYLGQMLGVGQGLVYNANNGLFEGQLLVALGPAQVSGEAYVNPGLEEWVTVSAVASVPAPYPDPYEEFTEGSTAQFNDGAAANPIGVLVDQDTYAATTAGLTDFVVVRYTVTNTNPTPLTDVYIGQFNDFDVGDFVMNLGGYDAATQLLYVFDNTGTNPAYYGFAAIAAPVSGWEHSVGAGANPTEVQLWEALTNGGGTIPAAPEDRRSVLGTGPYTIPAGGSQTVHFAYVVGDDLANLIANAAAVINTEVPVELVAFDAVQDGDAVSLRWETASETNNAGFEVQMDRGHGYEALGFVEGHGTTTEAQRYTYAVDGLTPGTYTFRLKQIDFDGAFAYHGDVEVTLEVADRFVLYPAYPNPFNPAATVRFAVRESAPVTVTLHDALGRQVARLYEATAPANATVEVRIDGSGLPSGLYLVRLQADGFSETTRITLLK